MSVPDDIKAILDAQSAAVTIPGTGPFFAPGTKREAFLLLHGWSASPESLRYLRQGIAEAGYGVLVPVLPGHGTDADDQARFGPHEWMQTARQALSVLRARYDKVHVLGVSMGGTLALLLAALEPDAVGTVTTVNGPVTMSDPDLATAILDYAPQDPLPGWSPPLFKGPPEPEVSYKDRTCKSAVDFIAVCGLARDLLPKVVSPILILQSSDDTIVDKSNAELILAGVGSRRKEIRWLHRSYHIAQLDLDRGRVVALALEFVA